MFEENQLDGGEVSSSFELVSSVPTIEPEEPSVTEPLESPELEVAESGAETPAVEPQLFDLPDGRKVTAEQVRAEYSNLLKDYTQKSQRLAQYERVAKPEEENIPEWKRPDYQPKTYAELIEIAQAQAIERIKEEQQTQERTQRELVSAIDAQIAEIKKTDPKLDENALFQHANKYGFRDLVQAHANYKAIEDAKLSVEQRTLKNVQARKDTPIAGKSGITTSGNDITYGEHQKYGSALDYLKAHIK